MQIKINETFAEWLALAFYVIVALCSIVFMWATMGMPPRLPCAVAEISPDITQAERERCRQIRGHKL